MGRPPGGGGTDDLRARRRNRRNRAPAYAAAKVQGRLGRVGMLLQPFAPPAGFVREGVLAGARGRPQLRLLAALLLLVLGFGDEDDFIGQTDELLSQRFRRREQPAAGQQPTRSQNASRW